MLPSKPPWLETQAKSRSPYHFELPLILLRVGYGPVEEVMIAKPETAHLVHQPREIGSTRDRQLIVQSELDPDTFYLTVGEGPRPWTSVCS